MDTVDNFETRILEIIITSNPFRVTCNVNGTIKGIQVLSFYQNPVGAQPRFVQIYVEGARGNLNASGNSTECVRTLVWNGDENVYNPYTSVQDDDWIELANNGNTLNFGFVTIPESGTSNNNLSGTIPTQASFSVSYLLRCRILIAT